MAEYYQIKKERQIYHGVRIFRFEYNNPYVTQVCLSAGETKKGKGHYVGVYLISRESFLANYLGMSVDKCTKAKFDKEFKNLTSKLK
jgi:hypothetical protein